MTSLSDYDTSFKEHAARSIQLWLHEMYSFITKVYTVMVS